MSLGLILASVFWISFFTLPYVNIFLHSPFEPWAWSKLEKYAERYHTFSWFAPMSLEDLKSQLNVDKENPNQPRLF